MYDELVKDLREVEEMLKVAQFKEATNLIDQAADAIEHMQKTILRLENELGIYDDLPMVDQSMVLSETEKTTQEQPSHSPSLGYYYAFEFDETTGETYMPKEE